MRRTRRSMEQELGGVATEHAILIALIAVAIIATLTLLGDQVTSLFDLARTMFPD